MKILKLASITARSLSILALASTTALAALEVSVRDEGSGDALWAKPRIFITNTGNAPSTISSVRYYFNKVSGKSPALEVWDAGGAPGYIVDGGSQYYAEINMGGLQLAAGESLRWGNGILFGLHNTDWSAWNKSTPTTVTVQSNDQSYPPPNPPDNDEVINSIGSDCWENYALLAQTSITLLDRTLVTGTAASAGTIILGTDSDVNQGSLYGLGTIGLQDRTYIGGDVRSAAAINQGQSVQVTGVIAPYSSNVPQCAVNAPSGSATPGTTAIYVPQDGTQELAPGTYGIVEVGYNATLVLNAGQYVFGSLLVREDAGIRLTSGNLPVKVLSVNPFSFKDRSRITMDGQEAARRFQLTTVSSGTSLIGYDTRLKGTYAAPSGTVQLLDRASVTGGIVAKAIQGNYDAQAQWAPRLSVINLPPTVVLSPLQIAASSTTAITTNQIRILDSDTPLDQIRITYAQLPMGGHLTKNGQTMNVGETFTIADIEANRIQFVHVSPSVIGDLVLFDATDGVNTVRFRLSITVN